MNDCFIALGSNLHNPLQQVTSAIHALSLLGTIKAQSPWYQSQAIGPGLQDDYINGVVHLLCELTPLELLAELHAIENAHGRTRIVRWGERTLDLDILLYNQLELNSATLTLPHPRITERHFVVYPLFDIAPELILPNGQSIKTLKHQLNTQGLEKLPQNE